MVAWVNRNVDSEHSDVWLEWDYLPLYKWMDINKDQVKWFEITELQQY